MMPIMAQAPHPPAPSHRLSLGEIFLTFLGIGGVFFRTGNQRIAALCGDAFAGFI